MDEWGFSYPRTAKVYRWRPDAQTLADWVQEHPHGLILALDPMSLDFQATLTRVGSLMGPTPLVEVHPQRDQVHFYGALNLRAGPEIARSASETTPEMTANFLSSWLRRYPQPMLLLLDRAPWHYGQVTTRIHQTDRWPVVYFPTACPHLNPPQPVWQRARETLSPNPT